MIGLASVPVALCWAAVAGTTADALMPSLAPDARRNRAATVALAAAAALLPALCGAGLGAAIVCGGLAAAAVLDWASGFLVDELTISSAVLAICAAFATGNVAAALAGTLALAGPSALAGFASRGRALGWGDVKAFAALGAGLGPERGALALCAACALGLIAAAVRRTRSVRFGPHLACGAVLAAVAPAAWAGGTAL